MIASWRNVIIIGTSHISSESVKEIAQAVEFHKPAHVCVELDPQRYMQIMHPEERKENYFSLLKAVGLSGFVFAIIGKIVQKKLGNVVGTSPGSEMKEAILQAKKTNSQLHLIDAPIQKTLKDISGLFTFREKARLFLDSVLPPKAAKALKGRKISLSKVPDQETINIMLHFIENRYSGLFEALIGKRNRIMAKRIFSLHAKESSSKIVAVVGAGHVEGMLKELSRLSRHTDIINR